MVTCGYRLLYMFMHTWRKCSWFFQIQFEIVYLDMQKITCAAVLYNTILISSHLAPMEHRLAYLIVVCCLLMHMTVIGSDIVFYHMTYRDGSFAFIVSKIPSFLLFYYFRPGQSTMCHSVFIMFY